MNHFTKFQKSRNEFPLTIFGHSANRIINSNTWATGNEPLKCKCSEKKFETQPGGINSTAGTIISAQMFSFNLRIIDNGNI